MLKKININIKFVDCVLMYFTGYAFYLTPGRMGETIRSKYLKEHHRIAITKSAPTIIVERIYDVIGIIIIAMFTSSITFGFAIFYVAVGLVLMFYFLIYQKKIILRLLEIINKIKHLSKISNWVLESFDIIYTLLRPAPTFYGTILTIGSWVLEGIGVFIIFYGFGIDIPIHSIVFIFVISSLIGNAILSPGGIGGTELSMVGLLYLFNYEYNEIILSVLTARMLTIFIPMLIGVISNIIVKQVRWD